MRLPGQVFPPATRTRWSTAAVDKWRRRAFIVKNCEGDVMNFTMAAEMAGRSGKR